jgi:photosystem II stability/assembly factor-like uncharacterized protein
MNMSRTRKVRYFVSLFIFVVLLQSSSFSAWAVGADAPEPDKFTDWQVVGPSGGDVRVVAIDPRDKNRLYISTLDGQIHTSADGGRTWRLLVNLNQPELVLDQLFVDSRDSKIIYASGHRHIKPGGFFRTIDGGVTWKEAKELKNESIHSMTQSTFDPNILMVGTTTGAWISKNSGADWEKLTSGSVPVNIDSLAMDPRNANTVYAGTWWRPYKSTDAGKTWRLIKDGMIDDSDVFAVTLDPKNPDHVIASACSGIYESQNAGERWAKIQGIPSQSRRTRDILQNPVIPGAVYAATTEGFWMTSNGGKTWALTTQRNLEINSIAMHPDEPNRIFIGTNNYGVMVSNDGGKNFVPTNDTFSSRMTYSITPDVAQPDRLYAMTLNTATGGGFFFTSNNRGGSWTQARNLDADRVRPFVVAQDRVNPALMYLGTSVGVFKSLDRGDTWTLLTAPKPVVKPKKKPVGRAVTKKTASVVPKTPPPEVSAGPVLVPALNESVRVIEILPGSNGLLAGTDTGLYRSFDTAKGWEKIPLPPGMSSSVMAVHVAPSRPDTIWLGTETSGVLVSHDSGKTWARTGGAVENVPVSSIMSDPKRPDYIYVGTVQAFYLSRDGGQTWARKGGNLPLGNYTSILINPDNTNEVIISSAFEKDGGIYISSDAGNKWKRIDSKEMKIASRRVWTMAFDPNDPNRIFAGTHSSGVYRIERGSTTTATSTGAVTTPPAGTN